MNKYAQLMEDISRDSVVSSKKRRKIRKIFSVGPRISESLKKARNRKNFIKLLRDYIIGFLVFFIQILPFLLVLALINVSLV